MRIVYLVFAYFFLALAIVGIFFPGLPTVPFLLLTAWFASKGSARLHKWLYDHPHIGKLLIDWETKKAISRTSKVLAVLILIVSWVVMYHTVSNVWLVLVTGIFFAGISLYLVTRREPDHNVK